jgi:hypothetical protein
MEKWAHEELGIPLSEAASFFMRIRTPRIDTEKVAEVLKVAVEKAEKTDDELKEEGRKRGVTALSAEATRESGRKGARVGKAVGSIAGGVGGAALGKKLIGGKAGAIAGLAAGMMSGGRVGEELGTEHDSKKNAPKFTPISKLSAVLPMPPEAYGPMAELAHQQVMQRQDSMGRGGALVGGLAAGLGGSLAQGLLKGPTGAASLLIPGAMAIGGGLAARHTARKAVERKADAVRDAVLQRGKLQGMLASHMPPQDLSSKIASMRMQVYLQKLADDGSMMAPAGEQDQGAMAPPPPDQELAPQNYLQAELMGQQAQEAQEQSFYREQLKAEQGQNQQLQAQMQSMQEQLQAAQAQAQQVVQAQDDATQQAQAAADARVSAQRMRAQILDLVSKDPSMFSIEQGQPPPGAQQPQVDANGQPVAPDAGMGQPAPEGPAAAAPSPQTAPGAAPPDGAADMNAPAGPPPGGHPADAAGTPTDKTSADWAFYEKLAAGAGRRPFDGTPAEAGKCASVQGALPLIGAGIGAAGGAYGSIKAGRGVEGAQQRVQELEGGQDGSFGKALELSKARGALAAGQLSRSHPVASAAMGGLGGAVGGGFTGLAVANSGQSILSKLKDVYGK